MWRATKNRENLLCPKSSSLNCMLLILVVLSWLVWLSCLAYYPTNQRSPAVYGYGFNSQSRNMPMFQIRSQSWSVQEATKQCFSPSLSPSLLPLSLKSICISSGEELKKKSNTSSMSCFVILVFLLLSYLNFNIPKYLHPKCASSRQHKVGILLFDSIKKIKVRGLTLVYTFTV